MGQLGAKGDARHPDEFRVTLGELAEAAKLNMAEDLQAITADLWANKQCCTCQTREVLWPLLPRGAGGQGRRRVLLRAVQGPLTDWRDGPRPGGIDMIRGAPRRRGAP